MFNIWRELDLDKVNDLKGSEHGHSLKAAHVNVEEKHLDHCQVLPSLGNQTRTPHRCSKSVESHCARSERFTWTGARWPEPRWRPGRSLKQWNSDNLCHCSKKDECYPSHRVWEQSRVEVLQCPPPDHRIAAGGGGREDGAPLYRDGPQPRQSHLPAGVTRQPPTSRSSGSWRCSLLRRDQDEVEEGHVGDWVEWGVGGFVVIPMNQKVPKATCQGYRMDKGMSSLRSGPPVHTLNATQQFRSWYSKQELGCRE